MKEEDEYLKAEIDREKEEIDYDALQKATTQLDRAALFRDIIRPDFHEQIKYDVGDGKKLTPFTKELKTSFLKRFDMQLVEELSDIATLLIKVGAISSAKMLLQFRDTKLSAAPSLDAMLLRLMNTEYRFNRIGIKKEGSQFFRRGGGEQEWQS